MLTHKSALASILALLLLASALLTSFPIIPAFALSNVDLTVGDNPSATFYMSSRNSFMVLNNNTNTMTVINGIQHTILHTVALNTFSESGTYKNLWCGEQFCFLIWDRLSSNADRIVKYDMTTSPPSFVSSFVTPDSIDPAITGIDLGGVGFGSITIWYVREGCGGGATDKQVITLDGISMLESTFFTPCFTSAIGLTRDIVISGITTGTDYVAILNSAANPVRVNNIDTRANVCTSGAFTVSVSNGMVYSNGKFIFATDSTASDLRVIDTACVQTGAGIDLTLASTVRSMEMNSVRDELYAYQFNDQITTLDLSNATSAQKVEVWTYVSSNMGTVNPQYGLAPDTEFSQLLAVNPTIDKVRILVLDIDPSQQEEDAQIPVLPESSVFDIAGLLMCVGGFVNITSCNSTTGLPNNSDPKTNGSGLMLLFFLIIVSYAFVVWIHIQAMGGAKQKNVHIVEAMHIHPLILLVLVFVDVSIAFFFGWITDLIFYGMIVVMIGLGTFGMYSVVKGRGQ